MPSSSTQRSLAAFIHRGAWGDLYVSLAALAEVCELHERVVVVGSAKWVELIEPASWPEIIEIWVSENGWTCEVFRVKDANWVSGGKRSLSRMFANVQSSYNVRTESLRYGWAPLVARVPERYGSAPRPQSLLFYTHRSPWLGKDPQLHERDRMLQVIEGPGRRGWLSQKWAMIGLPALKRPDPENGELVSQAKPGTYWLFNPTSSRREKAWPSANVKKLIAVLEPKLHERGLTWRLIGAPSETEWLREALPEGRAAHEFIVQPKKIADLCDVLSGAKALVTNTSSMQFLTPGYGVRTLTLMGRGDPAIWGPLGPRDRVVQGEIDRSLDGKMFEQEQKAYESISFEKVNSICTEWLGV